MNNWKIKLAVLVALGFLIKTVMSVILNTGFGQWPFLVAGAIFCLWFGGWGLLEEAQKVRADDLFELQDTNLWLKSEDELNAKWELDYKDRDDE